MEKIQRKGYTEPEIELEDIVGYRIVCLFTSDLSRLSSTVRSNFVILREEDKVEGTGDPATFGYMSNHFICKLGDHYSGPRYDKVREIKIEIQCRTILMDAWANVSHYLSYKGEASIPDHLRKDFHALSGLFYVADKHFELFFGNAVNSAEQTLSRAADGVLDDDAVNAETVRALFEQVYPDRRHSGPASASEFVEEVVPLGYTSLTELRAVLESANEAALRYEKNHPPVASAGQPRKFSQVGIARAAMDATDHRYSDFRRARIAAKIS